MLSDDKLKKLLGVTYTSMTDKVLFKVMKYGVTALSLKCQCLSAVFLTI